MRRVSIPRNNNKVFIPLLTVCSTVLIVGYPKRDQKRAVDDRFYSLAAIDLQSPNSGRGIFPEKPIDNPGVVAAVSQRDLHLSDSRRSGGIETLRFDEGHWLVGTGSERNSHSDQNDEPGHFRDIALFHFC
jgi:hypothetical protein